MEASQFLITPDLTEAVELSGIPAGIYSARVTGIQYKASKANPNAFYFQWELTVFGAEGELTKFNNWKVTHRTMTSGKGAGMLKTFHKACTGTELTGSFDFGLLVGSEVQVTLVEGKNADGTPSGYPEVKSVKSIMQ
jgi:hypothetical protein